ncbi:helix-turn-helix domain-containing protein [Pseudoalteromonas piscicida]|uniref:helix-turn-helix domain-containing protein n=1 Tax=Pseudoalteromonas piscicida TaxID=43662 RepID=UPI0027E5A440|nr:helix-turn-helix transcriptional regulator [Pseudoalteromonas piscicida]WMO14493.1 helix-turn-helix transcriptional regulator [Pseudoalteromonas piscicida]
MSNTAIAPCYVQLMQHTLTAAKLEFAAVAQYLAINKAIDALDAIEFMRVMEHCAVELNDESLNLNRKKLLPGTNEFVFNSLRHCRTITQLLQELARGYNFIHAGTYNFCEVSHTQVSYIIDDAAFDYATAADAQFSRCMLDSMLILIHGLVKYVCAETTQVQLTQVQTKSDSSSLLNSVITHIPIKPVSNRYLLTYQYQETNHSLDLEKLEHLTLNTIYHSLARTLHHQQSINDHANLLDKVYSELNAGTLCQEQMADKLNISPATLRRRLAEYQTSFRQLKNNVQNKQAKLRLTQGSSLYEVAHTLQFSDERSFIRAFKSWNGVTPMQFLQSLSSTVKVDVKQSKAQQK